MEKKFSWAWVFLGVALFTVAEVMAGTLLSPLVAGRFVTPMLRMRVDMLVHLSSFFVGGLAFGMLTPGVRLREPAVAALLSVALTFLMSVFLPHTFMHFALDKVAVSGSIACLLALFGTYTAERALGNFKNL